MDSENHLYVADQHNHRIQKFDSDGTFLMAWGEEGSCDGCFDWPAGVEVDDEGHVYVVEEGGSRIQKFTSEGEFITKCGGWGTHPGQMRNPRGITVDSSGSHIYVTDYGNNRIQVFKRVTLPDHGKAIIVAGGGPYPQNHLWDATQMSANFAYRALAYQGFTKESITYLSANTELDLDNNGEADDVDADATNANLEQAMVGGMGEADSVLLYLVDHGDERQFRMSGTETLSAEDLDAWLDTLQESMSGRVTVVYDACGSGSFVPVLSGASRTIVASTSAGEQAKFVTQGAVSFSNYFWTHVYNGESMGAAFDLSRQALSASFDDQTPLLDADGNGVGNEASDLDRVAQSYIGNGTQIQGEAPVIGAVSGAQTISGTTEATISATEVADSEGIARVWAVIHPPYFSGEVRGNPVLEFPSVDLMPQGEDAYAGTYRGFNAEGMYHIAVYARDRGGNTSIPKLTTVQVEDPLQRKALLVAGGPETDYLWPAVEQSALQAYESLKGQGYSDEEIYFLSPVTFSAGVDGTPVLDNVAYGLTNWGPRSCQDMVVYLVGRGGEEGFALNGEETLGAAQLDTWLDTLQGEIPGTVTVICDVSHAGGWLGELVPPAGRERIVIASTGEGQEAAFTAQGELSFTRYFWRHVLNGMDVRDAFVTAKNAIWYARGQTARMDDNGDGVFDKSDGRAAQGHRLGAGILVAGDAPVIGSAASGGTLYGGDTTTVSVEGVTSTKAIEKVWAVVSNSTTLEEPGPVPIFDLSIQGGGLYEGEVSGLTGYGRHEISVYAMDENGDVSMPAVTSVWQAFEGVPGTRGDLDGSGEVDLEDARLALEVVSGTSPAGIRADYASSGADVNGDGRIGMEEGLYILEVVSGFRDP